MAAAASITERLSLAREAVERLTAPRLAFRQFYDSLLAEFALEEAQSARTIDAQAAAVAPSAPPLPKSYLHAIHRSLSELPRRARALDPQMTRDAAALALAALGTRERMAHAASSAVAAGLFDPPQAVAARRDAQRRTVARALRRTFGATDFRARLQRATLQQFTSPDATFPDPDLLLPAILQARQRLCRVECFDVNGDPVVGTGFLIGPSAVLTNWHVVEHAAPGSLPQVVFDYGQSSGLPTGVESVVPVHGAPIARSGTGDLEPPGAPEAWWTDPTQRAAWRSGLGGSLDFAILRLEGVPGLQRGWYDLASTAKASLRGSCFVLHHPNGQGRTITAGEFCLHSPPQVTSYRVFHTASTARGSSGGLVINMLGQAVGLHYLGLGPDPFTTRPTPSAPAQIVNVAVPLAAIHATLTAGDGQAFAEVQKLDRLVLSRGCVADGRPVFGREGLIQAIPELKSGARQVLWIQPPEGDFQKPGKSYTVDILEALMPPPDNVYIKVSADQVQPGAKAMAALILRELSASAAAELPDSATTEAAYEQVLVAQLREVIAERWPARRIWLVIDDLDVHELTDAGGRRFLNTLYSRVRDIPQLRIVLLGLKVKLDTIPLEARVLDMIPADDLKDMARLFKTWLALRGGAQKPIDPRAVDLMAAALASYAGPKSPLEVLNAFTTRHLEAPLRTYFDK